MPWASDVRVERDVPATMRDGVTLYADVYRPPAPGRHPVVLLRSPYGRTGAQTTALRHPSWYARHGYVAVVQDTRGRHGSEGDFEPFAHEAEDGYETVEWAAELRGSNGRVGMYGVSYAGATQLLAATLGPPSLRAVCPGVTSSQFYDGWAYRGGALSLAFVVSWGALLANDAARRARDEAAVAATLRAALRPADLYGSLPLERLAVLGDVPWFRDWLAHPSYDDYWRRWSVDEAYDRITVPGLHVGGWYDIFAGGTVRNYEGLAAAGVAEQRLLVGPWHHRMHESGSGMGHAPASDLTVDEWHLRWFDRHLRDGGELAEPPATVWLLGADRWDGDVWSAVATPLTLYLHSGGSANSRLGDGRLDPEAPGDEPPDVIAYDPLFPMASAGGTSCCTASTSPMGPADQAGVELAREVLVYTTPPLDRDVTVAGRVSATVHAVTTADDADVTVKLCDVAPDGRSVNVAQGVRRGRYRHSLAVPEPIASGEVETYPVDLGPVAAVFRSGHRIRVQVSASDFPLWDRNLGSAAPVAGLGYADARPSTVWVLHEAGHPSAVVLPVVD